MEESCKSAMIMNGFLCVEDTSNMLQLLSPAGNWDMIVSEPIYDYYDTNQMHNRWICYRYILHF